MLADTLQLILVKSLSSTVMLGADVGVGSTQTTTGTTSMTSYGCVLVGPPGSGKTTYCEGVSTFLNELGRRTAIVNLDPANANLSPPAEIDISSLISLPEAMRSLSLGPNGGLVYCIEFLERNLDTWLFPKLDAIREKFPSTYFMLDLPGQVEIFTHHESLRRILRALEKRGFRLTCVHLVDAFHCSDPHKYISATMVSLLTMLRLELPQVNVLSKVDLIEQRGPLHFDIEYFTRAVNLRYLLEAGVGGDAAPERSISADMAAASALADEEEGDEKPRSAYSKRALKYMRLNEKMCDLIEEFSLVSFSTLNIQSKESVAKIVKLVDKANGCAYTLVDEEDNSGGMA